MVDILYDEPYFHCFQEALFPSLYIPLVELICNSNSQGTENFVRITWVSNKMSFRIFGLTWWKKSFQGFLLNNVLYFWARIMKYHPLSHEELFIFKVTFSFSHLACLDQKWKAKSSGRAPIKCKKENIQLPKNNSKVKNLRFKILIDKISSLSASKTQKNR